MSDFLERIGKLSPKRLALLALELNEQIEAAGKRAGEPLAVVGMACRFPGGAEDLERFWALLRDGKDAIREVPQERWDIDDFYDPDPDTPSGMSARNGGFLDGVDGFDAPFFGISPREAITMDPQQRLLLEVSWEALENAGIAPERLKGSPTGVFVGICNNDHFQRALQRGSDAIDAYVASGNAHSVAAGRISYFLGLEGPALAIDTACSSSLVALHVACQSLRNRETRMALAAGVNIMCSPETTISLTKAHMLAPDGRCKTFDDAADGFSRGEGCGVLVLKRLSDAMDDGDRILALIRGTATNQDGRSGGLTVPNGPAQEAVIRAALTSAGVTAADIDYVEAHGTGTSLGDPIEVRALAGALGKARPTDKPLLIGSVKTNIGHLESAAGIAGVIKVILCLEHEWIPPHLHFRTPSAQIPWADYRVRVTAAGESWPRNERRRLAGVSSFGFSGTNAHVVIEEAPIHAATAAEALRPMHCLALSARSEGALRELAGRHAAALASLPGAAALGDVAHTAGVGRSHFSERLAIAARTTAEAVGALAAFDRGEPHPALQRGSSDPGRQLDVVFMFTGQGSQYPGMSRALYDASPVFRDVIDRCDALLGSDGDGWTLKSVLWSGSQDSPIHETVWTQPALFCVEYALTQLWRSWGIEPAAVIGHSVGEYVAACVAGVFSLEEGLKLVSARARLMHDLPPGGAMAAVFASADGVARAIAPMADRLAIAAINAPDSVVVSGEAAAVTSLLNELTERNIEGRRLLVSVAAHSPLMDVALDGMQACAASVTMQAPRIPIAWNLTGGALPSGTVPDPTYWRRHLREPVRFAEGVARMYDDGYRTFLEVGPHPSLLALAERSLPEGEALMLTSLRRGKDDWHEMTASLGALYVRGATVDWAGVDRPYQRSRLALPTYPFERQSFWIAPATRATRTAVVSKGKNPLLGSRLDTAVPVFESTLTSDSVSYLDEHRLHGTVLAAGPVFLEMAQAAVLGVTGSTLPRVEEFQIREPLRLSTVGRTVQTHLGEVVDGAVPFSIYSRAQYETGAWQLHATGRLVEGRAMPHSANGAESPRDAVGPGPLSHGSDFYQRLARLGIQLGPRFQGLREVRRRDGAAQANVELPVACAGDQVVWSHPVLLDAAFQTVGLAVPVGPDGTDLYLLAKVESIDLPRPLPARFTCHARLRNPELVSPQEWLADVDLKAMDGGVIGALRGVCLRRASAGAFDQTAGKMQSDRLFYQPVWEVCAPAVPAAAQLRGPERFAARVGRQFQVLSERHGMAIYDDLLPELDRLSCEHIVVAMRQLGFAAAIGRRFTVADEAQRLGVAPRHLRLFNRLLGIMAEDGLLVRRDNGFEVASTLDSPAPQRRYEALLARFGNVDGELRTLRRCGGELAQVLRGEQDPLQLLFPGGAFDEARKLYVESPYARTYNGALAEALHAAIEGLPPDGRLRILEIGAGTGGTTSYVLPLLPANRVEYSFTDISPLFLERAAEQFAAYPFVSTSLLDIERDPTAQGFRRCAYDIVIAANVVHATADLGVALRHIRQLLEPQGLLFLLEGVAPERWVDLTFGLTEGWWKFIDEDLRPDYPLIGRERWLDLLARTGFVGVTAVPEGRTRGRGASQQTLLAARAPEQRRHWVLIGGEDNVAPALVRRLADRGDTVVSLPLDAPASSAIRGDNVVYLGALDLTDVGPAEPVGSDLGASLACSAPLALLGQLARGEFQGRVWLVTCGAQSVMQEPTAAGAQWQVPLWGVGRVFGLEHPDNWGGLVDLPPDAENDMRADTLLRAVDGDDGEDQTAWRGDQRFAIRLVQTGEPDRRATRLPLRLRSDATYLITGGYGGLGLVVARWMAERGARHLALLGRRPDRDAESVRQIESMGARIHSLQGDVSDEAAMRELLSELAAEAPPLRGIVHAAADLSAAPIADMTPPQVSRMLRPKIHGTVVLDRLGRGMDLDFLVLFSTTTALLGATGLAHYAAANLFLDAFATRTDRPDRRVVSINWGLWDVMRLASSEQQRAYREGGLLPMPAAEALEALERVLTGGSANPMVARIDWQVYKPLHEARRKRPMLTRLGHADIVNVVKDDVHLLPVLGDKLANSPASARLDVAIDFVSREVAMVLGADPGKGLPGSTGLFDLGMDSLMSVELKRRLERGTGWSLPPTLTFNYPNIAALAGFLLNLHLRETAVCSGTPAVAESVAELVAGAELSMDVDLDLLSDDEIESRLLSRVEQSR